MLLNFTILISLIIALEHLYFLYIELFAPYAKVASFFNLPEKTIEDPNMQKFIQNLGLFSGFVGLVLILTIVIVPNGPMKYVLIFLNLFIFLNGIYEGFVFSRKFFLFEALPGLLGMILAILI
ncbi:integral membrane protein [Pediococcus damnosus]|uniref:Integral membrane protein n=1 Tax=Pediococcus damnosus TaxID=51663 RepID=A0A0R2HPT6_9LACO|nr:DUF1304 family protein [Pediococcus damnosus]AMV60496.1 integral membrane protein [Pediococcus damnosus]AMV63038.1 integral membrane protein [Pediococcus damnosus]AMV64811.1 integral membrane protein [Pediococcus damnosus]AMV67073.1 integral membrane protein [Pediococcus damnosus]AMV69325.1 integral membrane protein [Pediococcus damnosus]